jgi:hypothetical protein
VLDKPNGKLSFGGEGSPVENHTCVLGPFGKYVDLVWRSWIMLNMRLTVRGMLVPPILTELNLVSALTRVGGESQWGNGGVVSHPATLSAIRLSTLPA